VKRGHARGNRFLRFLDAALDVGEKTRFEKQADSFRASGLANDRAFDLASRNGFEQGRP